MIMPMKLWKYKRKKKIEIELVFCWLSSGNCYTTKNNFESIVNPQFMDFICPIHTVLGITEIF